MERFIAFHYKLLAKFEDKGVRKCRSKFPALHRQAFRIYAGDVYSSFFVHSKSNHKECGACITLSFVKSVQGSVSSLSGETLLVHGGRSLDGRHSLPWWEMGTVKHQFFASILSCDRTKSWSHDFEKIRCREVFMTRRINLKTREDKIRVKSQEKQGKFAKTFQKT